MTDIPVPDEAVRIATSAPTVVDGKPVTTSVAIVAALARAGWLHDPATTE